MPDCSKYQTALNARQHTYQLHYMPDCTEPAISQNVLEVKLHYMLNYTVFQQKKPGVRYCYMPVNTTCQTCYLPVCILCQIAQPWIEASRFMHRKISVHQYCFLMHPKPDFSNKIQSLYRITWMCVSSILFLTGPWYLPCKLINYKMPDMDKYKYRESTWNLL